MKFSLGMLSHRMLSRKAILSTAVVLAVTGATGAAALLAPSDLGLSRLVPAVTAQTLTTGTNEDISAQTPFDRVAQAPTSETTDTPAASTPEATPFATTPSPLAPLARAPAARAPINRGPAAQAPVTRGPIASGPVAQAPIARTAVAQTPIAAPQGRVIMTSSPGVIVRKQHVQAKPIYRPRSIYVSPEFCAE